MEVLGGVDGEHYREFKRLFKDGFEAARKHCDWIVSEFYNESIRGRLLGLLTFAFLAMFELMQKGTFNAAQCARKVDLGRSESVTQILPCISKTIGLLCGSVVLWRPIATDTLRLPHSATVARLNNLLGYCGSVGGFFFSCLGQARIG
jgi:hypothetical protein